ncbi:MAG: hypothetical protein KAQ92_00455, partial [Candidatus Aenigmarchaeota archaeon]|nr:hypothetical protein [Candidatus Aenigmarchaeota archaeon]
MDDRGKMILVLLFITFALFLSRTGTFIYDTSDAYFHAVGGLFTYDFLDWWLGNPTISFSNIMNLIVNYQAQYKFLGGIIYYPPLQSVLIG